MGDWEVDQELYKVSSPMCHCEKDTLFSKSIVPQLASRYCKTQIPLFQTLLLTKKCTNGT